MPDNERTATIVAQNLVNLVADNLRVSGCHRLCEPEIGQALATLLNWKLGLTVPNTAVTVTELEFKDALVAVLGMIDRYLEDAVTAIMVALYPIKEVESK